MCGILGVIPSKHRTLDPSLISRADAKLVHRGPDDTGFLMCEGNAVQTGRQWTSREPVTGATMLHRRLSILDLSESGRQPMKSADGRFYVLFNGEIYNYLELKSELQSLGHSFRSRSDTEVLLAAFSQWGVAAFARLVGMFAIALLDVPHRKVILSRDFFGIKPLYYTSGSEGLAFASEIKALLELPWIRRTIHAGRLYLYLRYGITDQGSGSLFEHIRQVPPGHYLEVSLDNPQESDPVRFWNLNSVPNKQLTLNEAAARLRELFLESIRLHLRSDVPVGVTLSGGIDSSAIVMAMRHVAGRDFPIHAFSYIAEDPVLSEERWVDSVVGSAGATPHKVRLSATALAEDLGRLIACQEEPFGSTSIYAQFRVFKEARDAGIKVVISGQGADELLAGYRPYLGARLASLIRGHEWSAARRLVREAGRLPGFSQRALMMEAANFLFAPRLQAPLRKLARKETAPAWMNAEWFQARGVSPGPVNYTAEKNVLHQSLKRDLFELGLPHLLRYEDRNSMAFSIESRLPFLTPQLADFISSLPEEYLIAPDGTSKAVFRKAMQGIVPESILVRKDKIGFATPEKRWLSALQPRVDRTLRSDVAATIPVFRAHRIEQERQRVIQHDRAFSPRLWRIVNLIEWARQFDVRFD